MTKLFRILSWEFKLRFRSKSFLFTTISTPLFFALLIYIPTIQVASDSNYKLGLIDASEEGVYKLLENYSTGEKSQVKLSQIEPDESSSYNFLRKQSAKAKKQRDSLYAVYQWVKNKRTSLFLKLQKKKNKRDEKELIRLYDLQTESKDVLDSLSSTLKDFKESMGNSYIVESKIHANKLLNEEKIDAYIYLEPSVLQTGKVEYHSSRPGHFIVRDQFEQLITNIVFQNRLLKSKLNNKQTQEVLEPIEFSTFQLKAEGAEASQNFANYYGPIVAVMLMFISIFTSVGSVFSSFVIEKNNRILEFVLSTSTKQQIYFGKILGLCAVGLVQLTIWLFFIFLLVQFQLFGFNNIGYLTWENLSYFYIYYILGYFLFAVLLSGLSVIYMNEQESQNLNQFIRIAAVFPLLFALLVLENPNSETIRMLSFVPILTPSFMIMRIPLSSAIPIADIQITILVLLFSILIVYLISYRIFQAFSNYYGKRPSLVELGKVIWSGKI